MEHETASATTTPSATATTSATSNSGRFCSEVQAGKIYLTHTHSLLKLCHENSVLIAEVNIMIIVRDESSVSTPVSTKA